MKKLLLAGIFVASSLFANSSTDNQNEIQQTKQVKKVKKRRINKRNFISLVKHLDLTADQKTKIRGIVRKNRVKNKNPLIISIKNGKFDKEIYIKTRKENSEKSIQKRAEIIEKIYSILTPEQKSKLDLLLHSKIKK
jgi:Spy/CpxP family protein refolding chaperone